MLVALLVILVSCGSYGEKKYDEYCYKINQKVKELDFFTGKIMEKKLIYMIPIIILYQDYHLKIMMNQSKLNILERKAIKSFL